MSAKSVVFPKFYKNIRKASFLWNLCFRMKYLDFRKRLSEIASLSYSSNSFDDIIPYLDFDHINSLDPGTLLVPMDDDDWFSPSLAEILRKEETSKTGIYWDEHVKSTDGIVRYENRHDKVRPFDIVDSCCYGIKVPCHEEKIKYHWVIRKPELLYLPKRLSMKVESIGAMSVLYYMRGRFATVQSYRDVLKQSILKDIACSSLFPEEYKIQMGMYKDLMKELLESEIQGDMV